MNCSVAYRGWMLALLATAACGGAESKTVTPGEQAYAVGGHITGSNGNVTLACNSQTITVAGNGPFVCPDKLATGSAYDVTVQDSPGALSCTVTGGSGTVGTADVTDVAVNCDQTSFSVTLSMSGLLSGGSLSVSLGGVVQEVSDNGDLPVMLMGTSGESVPVSITAQPAGQQCILNLTQVNFSATPAAVAVLCARYLRLASGAAADTVLGQSDFVTTTAPVLPAPLGTLNGPTGRVAGATNGLVYISEYGGNQVTALMPGGGASGAFRLGVDVTQNPAALYGNQDLRGPTGVATDDTHLAVASNAGSRVLLYNTLPTAAVGASVVVGQAAFGSAPVITCSPNNFVSPTDVTLANGKLFVADSGCNRVVIFDPVPVADGAGASLVLGQPDFTHYAVNRGLGASPNTLNRPGSVWADSNSLFVADAYNNRVLAWLTMPTTNGQPADVVLGQPSFSAVTGGTGSNAMSLPYGLVADEHLLIVADTGNNRVLMVPLPLSTALTPQATGVLGQADFTSSTRNAPSQQPSANGMYQPTGLGFFQSKLLVNDGQNNRVLGYTSR